MMKFSVIILSFNTKDLLAGCLQAIESQNLDIPGKDGEVIVVDNGSTDGTPEVVAHKFPKVHIIAGQTNLGFAAGNNRGLKKAKGEIILLLNSDTRVMPDTLQGMVEFMDAHPDAGAATPRLELPDGSLDLASHRGFPTPWNAITYLTGAERLFPNTKWFSGYHQTWKDFNLPHEVNVISGACFFVRRKVIREIGLLDERFFMYAEDIDWCLRLKQAGWKIYYNPAVKVIHLKKRSGRSKAEGGKIDDETRKIRAQSIEHFYKTMQTFYDKHYGSTYPIWVRHAVLVGIRVLSKIRLLRNRLAA